MTSALSIGVSALQAATVRLAVTADNIVNANTRVPVDAGSGAPGAGGYVPRDVVDVSSAAGVTATVRPVDPPSQVVPDGRGGLEASPNVNLAEQMVELTTASRAYESATAVIRSADEMQDALLDIVG
ncbi:flagellar basal body rod protein FlgC [Roseospira visakhapatnamensis]|uniref:Flagellar basal-body rod protein FlgC n=1 Tax=Roseospira visakhapatnamensis TaxID=390880 RepID=A0A7W6RHR2_9PROT|nr:flagellar basal body rod C-terminal domain-containing protein [Roseospira visakhapatnamensis]MBB4268244.1 flagellar basal-body rod protein FlgC [Roseospira visakhapatnamensis]